MCRVNGFGDDHKTLLLAGLPIIHQMTVPAGAFVAKIARENARAFGDQRDAIIRADFVPVHAFAAAVPDAENNPPLRRAVDLHAKVAAMPAARLEIGPQRRH